MEVQTTCTKTNNGNINLARPLGINHILLNFLIFLAIPVQLFAKLTVLITFLAIQLNNTYKYRL